ALPSGRKAGTPNHAARDAELVRAMHRGRSRPTRSCGEPPRHLTDAASTATPFLRRRDLDAFLLAGIRHIADGGPLYVAPPAPIVELGSPVHRAAIVPHHEIVDPPAMGIDELPLRRVRGQLIDQCATLVLGHAEDPTGVRREVERFAPGFRDRAHE